MTSFDDAWRDYSDETRRIEGRLGLAEVTHPYMEDEGTTIRAWVPETSGLGETYAVMERADALAVLARIREAAYDASARAENFEYREQPGGGIRYVDHANGVRGTLLALAGGKVDMASLGPFFSVQKWYGATGPYFRLQRDIALYEGRELPDTTTLRENFGLSPEDAAEARRIGTVEHDYDRLAAFLAERGVALDIIVKGGPSAD